MGVAGAVGLLKRNQQWGRTIELKNTSVVVDVTESMYWFAKKNLLRDESGGMDKYGSSMFEYGQFIRELIKRFRERQVRPIFVFDGSRKSEIKFGPIASKARHLEHSCATALSCLRQGLLQKLTQLPKLATSCLKEVINECGLATDQLHQAVYEVYPLLEKLARDHHCPVMTSHSDFIFYDVPHGFIWFDQLEVPGNSHAPIKCRVYHHANMLATNSLEPRHSPALKCLSILLRDDFSRAHYEAVNHALNLSHHSEFRLRPFTQRVATRRLVHVLENWPRERLTYIESVREALIEQSRGGNAAQVTRDFDAMLDCYARPHEFATSELARTFAAYPDQLKSVCDALTHRESSADFLATLKLTNYNRTPIEDVTTYRSTFSLQDRVRQYVMERVQVPQMRIYDRRQSQMEHRTLACNDQQVLQVRLDRDVLFTLFHFDERRREAIANRLSSSLQIDADHSARLALLLLLARYGLKLVARDHYDNTDQFVGPDGRPTGAVGASGMSLNGRAGSRSSSLNRERSNSSASDASQQAAAVQRYLSADTKKRYFTAIVNSFVYHQMSNHQGDQSRSQWPCEIRVAWDKIEPIDRQAPTVRAGSGEGYYTSKHLVEVLNSTLHAYKELNSLYNFPGPNVLVNRYYSGVLIYKLMSGYTKNLQEHLLQLDSDLQRDLIELA